MSISSAKGDTRILSRLISAGKWTDELKPDGPGGYSVWRWDPASSSIRRRHFPTVDAAVAFALRV
jgi:hypothetical protein